MISGDSTASHIGTAKNIEKARERRTFEVMPGSTAVGIPEELQEHTQTIHPRMGYDMSDSLFMQQQEAADRAKESKKAQEERVALEAFRAAALQKPFDPVAAASSGAVVEKGAGRGGNGGAGGESKRKQPPPLVGIKIRKKRAQPPAEGVENEPSGEGEAPGAGAAPDAGGKRSSAATVGGQGGEGEGKVDEQERGVGSESKKGKKKKGSSKKPKRGKRERQARESGGGGQADEGSNMPAAVGLGMGLVGYSSGDDDEG